MREFLEGLIKEKQESEIGKFQEIEAKIDIKNAYAEYLKGKLPEQETRVATREEDQKERTDDMANLIFLKSLRKWINRRHAARDLQGEALPAVPQEHRQPAVSVLPGHDRRERAFHPDADPDGTEALRQRAD